jgi:hypothetical protein
VHIDTGRVRRWQLARLMFLTFAGTLMTVR